MLVEFRTKGIAGPKRNEFHPGWIRTQKLQKQRIASTRNARTEGSFKLLQSFLALSLSARDPPISSLLAAALYRAAKLRSRYLQRVCVGSSTCLAACFRAACLPACHAMQPACGSALFTQRRARTACAQPVRTAVLIRRDATHNLT